jgi:hypothetical protein
MEWAQRTFRIKSDRTRELTFRIKSDRTRELTVRSASTRDASETCDESETRDASETCDESETRGREEVGSRGRIDLGTNPGLISGFGLIRMAVKLAGGGCPSSRHRELL